MFRFRTRNSAINDENATTPKRSKPNLSPRAERQQQQVLTDRSQSASTSRSAYVSTFAAVKGPSADVEPLAASSPLRFSISSAADLHGLDQRGSKRSSNAPSWALNARPPTMLVEETMKWTRQLEEVEMLWKTPSIQEVPEFVWPEPEEVGRCEQLDLAWKDFLDEADEAGNSGELISASGCSDTLSISPPASSSAWRVTMDEDTATSPDILQPMPLKILQTSALPRRYSSLLAADVAMRRPASLRIDTTSLIDSAPPSAPLPYRHQWYTDESVDKARWSSIPERPSTQRGFSLSDSTTSYASTSSQAPSLFSPRQSDEFTVASSIASPRQMSIDVDAWNELKQQESMVPMAGLGMDEEDGEQVCWGMAF